MSPIRIVLTRVLILFLAMLAVGLFIDYTHATKTVTKQVALTNADALKVAGELMDAKSFRCLKYVIMVESHNNPEAKSQTSSAKGVGQLLASTYRNLGLKHSNDPRAQVIATLAYISERYGSGGACAAMKHEIHYNWF